LEISVTCNKISLGIDLGREGGREGGRVRFGLNEKEAMNMKDRMEDGRGREGLDR